MSLLRRLSFAALLLAFAQIVFGAIVRITGSGLGCGDHWPKCHGMWFPPFDRPDLIIEITHRYIAAALTAVIAILWFAVFRRRRLPGVGGQGGVLRPVTLAILLVLTAAIFGAVTVKLDLNAYVIVTHLTIAMTLLAVLVVATIRAGGLGVSGLPYSTASASARTYRSARIAVALSLLALVFGALTANVVGAAGSCQGFPWCRSVLTDGAPLHIQLTHRIIAFLLLFHLFGMVMSGRKREESGVIKRAVRVSFGIVVAQILVAATMVEMHLPPAWQSIHQAVGTLVWLSVVTTTVLARHATFGRPRFAG